MSTSLLARIEALKLSLRRRHRVHEGIAAWPGDHPQDAKA
jgi:hypothetical protein